MPGISFIFNSKDDLSQKEFMINKSLDSLLYFDRYKKVTLLKTKSLFLNFTKYEEYPIATFENDQFYICLEGKMYGKDDRTVKTELNNLAKAIFQSPTIRNDEIVKWLLDADGDFVIFLLSKKTNEIVIMNDLLGRLPLYYYHSNKEVIVSREVNFISKLLDKIEFDKMAIAQYLLFLNPLGERSLLKNIYRLAPASIIKINSNNSRFEFINLYTFNFENKKFSTRTIEENASELSYIFSEACRRRAKALDSYKSILSLSGGLDSRAVAAGLKINDIPYYGITMQYKKKCPESDRVVAEQIASLLNMNWKIIILGDPKGKDMLKLLKIKSGANYLAMSFILPYLEEIINTYGTRIVFYTGDSGTIMKRKSALKEFSDVNELAKYILKEHAEIPLDDVAEIVGISKNEIMDEIRNQLSVYPETTIREKYLHFNVYESSINWNQEGMDRNRYYFWMAAPLKANHFFSYAVNCPDEQKLNFNLYRKFLLKLSPQIADIDYSNYNSSITSMKFKSKLLLQSAFRKLPPSIRGIIRHSIKPQTYSSVFTLRDCFHAQLRKCGVIDNYMSRSKIIDKSSNYRALHIETLFTITSLIEYYLCEHSTIEDYYDSELF